jgi:hypothetical protein
MQGAQWGKLVQVQHCPATVTPLVKSDDPPFMTQSTSWKGKLGIGFTPLSRPHPAARLGGFDLTTFSLHRSFYSLSEEQQNEISQQISYFLNPR